MAQTDVDRISLAQLDELRSRGEPVFILDVRKSDAYRDSATVAVGAIRVDPDRAVEIVSGLGLPQNAWLISYCT